MNYQFHINDFEGPLDLLLHLIKVNEMDIYDINISEITEQYINFINEVKENEIDIAADYLLMASELVHIKSNSLINTDNEEEEEEFEIATKEELTKRLLEYQAIKELTTSFQELSEKRSEIYTKLPSDLSDYKEEVDLTNQGSLDDLVNAFQLFLERQKHMKPLSTKITRKEYSIEERTISIRNILKEKKQVQFFELFDNLTKSYVVVTFLSVLEMTKNNEIKLTQENSFSPLIIEMK